MSFDDTNTPTAPSATTPQTENIRYEAVLANIGDGLVVTDKKGIIITFNKAAERMLGWTATEAVGKQLHDIVVIEYVNDKGVNKLLGNDANSAGILGQEQSLFFVRKNKTRFPAALKVTSYVSGNEMLGTITLFRDITTERSIDQMKTEFISLASHQLKTPLSAMRWYVKMLISGDGGALNQLQLQFAQSIQTATFRMIDLVNGLLNISRIESGRIIIDPKPTQLQTLIADIIQDLTSIFQQRKQRVQITAADTIPVLSLDPRLISQIYLNLLSNASKYSPEGKQIHVTLSIKDEFVLTAVQDQGYGIPEADKDKVFGRFYRGENIITKVADGTGLGLYLVKSLVELSGGSIWFESREGEGTTFFFTLPVRGMTAQKGVVILDEAHKAF